MFLIHRAYGSVSASAADPWLVYLKAQVFKSGGPWFNPSLLDNMAAITCTLIILSSQCRLHISTMCRYGRLRVGMPILNETVITAHIYGVRGDNGGGGQDFCHYL